MISKPCYTNATHFCFGVKRRWFSSRDSKQTVKRFKGQTKNPIPVSAVAACPSSYADEVLRLHNQYRAENGAPAMVLSDQVRLPLPSLPLPTLPLSIYRSRSLTTTPKPGPITWQLPTCSSMPATREANRERTSSPRWGVIR